jgi:hypothetical protein
MADFTDRELGQMETRIAILEQELHEVRRDTREILTTLSEAKGSWKTMMMLAGFSAAMGAFVSQVLLFLPIK